MPHVFDRIAVQFDRHVVESGRESQFYILCSFILTFLAIRALVHGLRTQRVPLLGNVTIDGTHIHHLVPGIVLLLATGYIAVAIDPEGYRRVLAVFFGIGAALTLDEFALWLHLEDVYFHEKGRRSIDVVIVTTALLALFMLGIRFWVELGHEALRVAGVA